jgi:peroxiredoxin
MIKKISFFFCFLVIAFNINAQENYSIDVEFQGVEEDHQLYLGLQRGAAIMPIDSALLKDGKISFQLDTSAVKGIYRLILNDSTFLDVIFNKENISLKTDNSLSWDKTTVLRSEENRLLCVYYQNSQKMDDKIEAFMAEGQLLYEEDRINNQDKLLALKDSVFLYEQQKNAMAESIMKKNPQQFAAKYIIAQTLPVYTEKAKNSYKNKFAFLQEHFFDNIDFTENTFVQTGVLFYAMQDYLSNFVQPKNTAQYTKAVDKILALSADGQENYSYCLEILMRTFEQSPFEEVYIYIVENYYFHLNCNAEDESMDVIEKLEALKSIKIGSKAPNIQLPDTLNTLQSLYEIDAKAILVVFWASWCDHCQKEIPQLKTLYKKYQPNGFEIFAVGIESNPTSWKKMLNEHELSWINLSDFSAFQSKAAKDYHIWQTPSYFLLNEEKKIHSRPISPGQIESDLIEILF